MLFLVDLGPFVCIVVECYGVGDEWVCYVGSSEVVGV